jgi:hypothetical protein
MLKVFPGHEETQNKFLHPGTPEQASTEKNISHNMHINKTPYISTLKSSGLLYILFN